MPVSAEGFKGGDRTTIELPAIQRRLVGELKKLGKPIIFVNYSVTMLQQRLAAGERYDLMIDLHRDAYPGGSQGGANAVTVGSAKLARLMLLVGKGEGQTGRGFDEKPGGQPAHRPGRDGRGERPDRGPLPKGHAQSGPF